MKFALSLLAALAWSTVQAYSSSSSKYTYNGDAYGTNFFVDTDTTYYDGYQQAWRYLGWYVKCGAPSDRYDESHSHSGSQDQDDFFKGNNWCQRYLIWAAVSGGLETMFVVSEEISFFPHTNWNLFCSTTVRGRGLSKWRHW